MRIFIVIILFAICNISYGQTEKAIEEKLLAQYKRIHYWANDKSNDLSDSLVQADSLFCKTLLAFTSATPSTITFPFNELVKEGLTISTSEDGLFRIYSWDTETGGTMHFYLNVYQY